MITTVILVYIGVQLYYTIEAIKKSIKQQTVIDDIDRNWNEFKKQLIYIKSDLLRKKNRCENGGEL